MGFAKGWSRTGGIPVVLGGVVNLTTHETAREIALLVRAMMDFWKSSNGWPPIEASSLLDRSMLEWQVSLSDCLEKWAGDLTQGERILAWANIGALVEGQLKLFLAVYYLDYIKDVDAIVDRKTGSIVDRYSKRGDVGPGRPPV